MMPIIILRATRAGRDRGEGQREVSAKSALIPECNDSGECQKPIGHDGPHVCVHGDCTSTWPQGMTVLFEHHPQFPEGVVTPVPTP